MADDDWGDDQESGGSSKKKSKDGGDEDWNEGGGEDDGWGAGGGWEGGEMTDPEADTGGFVSSTAKGKGVKKIGIKLYVDLAKQVMLAIRNKKTGSDHFDDASALIQELYKEYMDQQSEKVADQKKKDKEKGKSATAGKSKEAPKGGEKKKTGNKECMICFSAFDDSEAFSATMTNCGHSTGCTNCFMKYLQNKIKEKDVTPWLCCMEEKCYQPLHHEDISGSGIVTLEMYQLADAYLRKMLVRNENWVPCSTKDCGFGFLVEGKVGTKLEGSMCGVCGTKQTVEKKEVGLDEEMKKMIKEGKLRACPICKLWTMKEYGLCNIIQCGKCAIWWNWRTNLTGKSSRDLKDKARADGSLWEPGELAYQQNLEATNPKAFKELLERNGMKYDPNYRRGGQKADED